MGFVKIGESSEIALGKMKKVKVGDKELLVANVNGNYYAMGSKCACMHVFGGKVLSQTQTHPDEQPNQRLGHRNMTAECLFR